jgi:hypothetical protein
MKFTKKKLKDYTENYQRNYNKELEMINEIGNFVVRINLKRELKEKYNII